MESGELPVSAVMRKRFASLEVKDRLDRADHLMSIGHVRHLPVLDPDGRLAGILSNRDMLEASLTNVLEFEPAQRSTFLRSVDVAEVMTRRVETVTEDTPLHTAAARMVAHKIGCLPVVDADDRAIGLVTETDLLVAAYLREPPDAAADTKPDAAGEDR